MKSTRAIGVFLLLGLIAAGVFFLGWAPRQNRIQMIEAEAKSNAEERLAVTVVKVKLSAPTSELTLPGNVSAVGETPIYARAEGYIKTRNVDIGDVVKKGDTLVEIDSPELDQQLRNAKARLEQLRASAEQVKAAIEQARANVKLAEINFGRSKQLVAEGVFAKADLDEKTAIFDARKADVKAQEANLGAANESIRAQLAEVARIEQLTDFKRVTAPWAGIITQRNCAVGNLITPSAIAAGRDLFRLSDISTLRVFVTVPQSNVVDIRVGQKATVRVPELNRIFIGKVARNANALENQSRTLLTEVNVQNQNNSLLPGMYVQVGMETAQARRMILVPGDTIVTRSDGTFVAIVDQSNKVNFSKITVGRDYGTEVEATSGVSEGDSLVVNPSDDVKNGVIVKATARK
ncbi:efflux RND transporter periplasmic adaptor subunit [Bryobacter aggregatus]|uniref:efflux RND transporter periplasmic adaptor subunit n=1 Tax=Bryobacter aggregatus TaxID=360054 RepID=UPI0006897E56|nr:efflux RND transporter periplasmic adaptor subunit [Bryobacter aggregatus]